MGFESPVTTYLLEFSDPKYAGLEVRVRAANIGEMFENLNLEVIEKRAESEEAAKAATVELHSRFIAKVTEWNLIKDGEPVPRTLEGLHTQELSFATAIVRAWVRGDVELPAPLAPASPGIGTFPEASIPTVTLPEPLAS